MRTTRAITAVALGATAMLALVAPAAAAETPEEEQRIIVENRGGRLAAPPRSAQNCYAVIDAAEPAPSTPPTMMCFESYAALLRSRGVREVADNATPDNVTRDMAASAGTLSIEYQYHNGGGASLSIIGDPPCSGGGISLQGSWWDNRISSVLMTQSSCTAVHWQFNYSGERWTVVPCCPDRANITGFMDNRTTSIQYFNF